MSDIYSAVAPILTGVAALAISAATYLLYRKREIIALSKELVDVVSKAKVAYEDKNVTEEEYGEIVKELIEVADKLKAVIYKK